MIGFPGVPKAVLDAAQSIEQRPTGIAALLADPALQQALIGTGTALLQQSDRPGTLGGALGRALPAGLNAFQEGRRMQEFEELLTGMPESQARVFRLLGPDAGTGALAQMFMQGPPEPELIAPGQDLQDILIELYGPVDPTTLTPDQVASAAALQQERELARASAGASSVTIEGERAASAAQGALGTDAIGRLSAARDAAVGATATLGRVGELQKLLTMPEAASVTGPGSSIKTLAQRFSDDPTAREIAAAFDALAGQNVLAGLEAFTGAISDAEREFLDRIQAGDRDMTVEELQAGLGVLERIQRDIAEGYLSRLDSFDGAAFGIGAGQLESAHAAESAIVRRGLGANVGADPLGIRN